MQPVDGHTKPGLWQMERRKNLEETRITGFLFGDDMGDDLGATTILFRFSSSDVHVFAVTIFMFVPSHRNTIDGRNLNTRR